MGFFIKLIVFGFIALIGGYYAIYFLVDTDPEGQAQKLRDAVKPGMAWTDVADIRTPKRVHRTFFHEPSGSVRDIESKYSEDDVRAMVNSGKADMGFAFPYVFSQNIAFSINFDANGVVTSITDNPTASDLFQGKLFQPSP